MSHGGAARPPPPAPREAASAPATSGSIKPREVARIPRASLAGGALVRVAYPPFDVLVTELDGHPVAIEDACNHAGASLCTGWRVDDSLQPDDQGPNIVCPVHAYVFALATGKLLQPESLCEDQRPFQTRIDGTEVVIEDPFHLKILPP